MVLSDREKLEELLCLGWLWRDSSYNPSLCCLFTEELGRGEGSHTAGLPTDRLLWHTSIPARAHAALPIHITVQYIPVLLSQLQSVVLRHYQHFPGKAQQPAGTSAIHNVAKSEDIRGWRKGTSLGLLLAEFYQPTANNKSYEESQNSGRTEQLPRPPKQKVSSLTRDMRTFSTESTHLAFNSGLTLQACYLPHLITHHPHLPAVN